MSASPSPIGEISRVLGGGNRPRLGGPHQRRPGHRQEHPADAALRGVAEPDGAGPVLYVSGEESAAQIKLRAERLGITTSNILVLADTHLESISAHIEQAQPRMVVVDSVQSIYSDAIQSGAGQRHSRCATARPSLASRKAQTFFAFPRRTRDQGGGYRRAGALLNTWWILCSTWKASASIRIACCARSRTASAPRNEVGVFEMIERGLAEVRNPSEAFLAERLPNSAGSAIARHRGGNPPILVEVQALTSTTTFAQPRARPTAWTSILPLLITAVLSKTRSRPAGRPGRLSST